MSTKETKKRIIQAGRKAVDELIKVAQEQIITNTEDDVSADRLKNAAATKKRIFWKERHKRRKRKEYLKVSRKADQNNSVFDVRTNII